MGGDDRLRGAVLGLGSALLFGLGAPVSKLLLPRTQPLTLAALLYFGAGAAFLVAPLAAAKPPLPAAMLRVWPPPVTPGAELVPWLSPWAPRAAAALPDSSSLNLEP